jgi:hypothetical protein
MLRRVGRADYDRRNENDAQEVSVARSPGAIVRREIVLVLILFTAIARLLLDYVHSRRASKEIFLHALRFFGLHVASVLEVFLAKYSPQVPRLPPRQPFPQWCLT